MSDRSVQWMWLSSRQMSELWEEPCFHRNLCVTQFDSVFIYGLSYGPMPVLFSIHCPHRLLTAEPRPGAYSCEVKPEVRASKGHMASGSHRRRLPSGRADRGQKEWTVAGSFLNVSTPRPGRFLKSSLIVASCTDEPLRILAFIRSDGDRRSVSRRRFSKLEKLLEDMKSFLRDEDHSASLIFLRSSSCAPWEDALACNYLIRMHPLHIELQ